MKLEGRNLLLTLQCKPIAVLQHELRRLSHIIGGQNGFFGGFHRTAVMDSPSDQLNPHIILLKRRSEL